MHEGSHVLWEDGERVVFRGSRPGPSGESRAVLIVLPAGAHPSPSSLERLVHHYELKDELDCAWAARPLEVVREDGRTMLVLEDPGGELLARLIGEPMELGRFLRLAIGMAQALGKAHQHGLVHKDLMPTHILVNRESGEARLIGFGIASRLPRQRQPLEPPETIAGTLAYMAPEQTGRMNRSIDSRSDLYSLGVTFYQMLTGSLPFAASDPMEWVHCHVARRPAPPAERIESVPAPVSQLVMKLLAKTAEERYQTAAGVERDLRRCLAAWEAEGRIDDFPLGAHDAPDRLLIPEKLYGREREIEILLVTFNRVVESGARALALVCGYSGIGKSSVVNELHKALVPARGLFASGKFDQYKRDIPYSTLVQAFQSLVRSLLGKSDAELALWRDSFREALEPNARLMTDLLPELKLIIGDQPPVPALEPQQAQNRFQLVLRRFIRVFARPEHPLVLFLDDLQWLDAATLDLLEDLLVKSDLQNLLLVGAYRDNEVDATHPLVRKLEAIRNAGHKIETITLTSLGREHFGQLIADMLHCGTDRAAPLALLVHQKTGGNPFFAIQFISLLAEEGLLIFDLGERGWSWDVARIHAKGYTNNVVALMAGKLAQLPAETQQALQQMGCVGNIAKITMLSIAFGTSPEQLHAALWPAVRQELIERREDSYKFVHDRVQEAAYSLIPEERRAAAHLRIGRLLVAHTPAEKREEAVFEIVNQLNRGAALIMTQEERDQLAELNLLAGKRAKRSAAYVSALRYFTAGRAQLDETGWEQRYRLTFDLEVNWAECEYVLGELALADERLTKLSTRIQTTVDSAIVTCLRINLYTTLDQSDSAVEVGLEYLRRVDGEWSPHPTVRDIRRSYDALRQKLGTGSIEAPLDLPPMRDLDRCATMDVLTVLTSPALFTDLNLFRLVVSRMATLSLEHGNSDGSCLAYAWLGGVLGTYFGEYQAGLRFGRLGLDLVETRGLDRFRARVYLVFAVHVAHWTQPLHTSRAFLRRAFDAALQAGDLSYAAYSCIDLITNRVATGDLLSDVEREAEHGLEFARKVRFGLASDCITGQLRLIRMLRGLTSDFSSFNDAEFDEGCFEQHLQSNPQLAIGACWYWIRRLQASVYVSDEASAVAAAAKAAPLLWTAPTQFELAEYHFYGALARAACCDLASGEERAQHLESLSIHYDHLAVWTENCPATFANRAALVGAEIARLEGRDLEAMRLYEEAIRLAREHRFIQNEGLAHERAGRFCLARGFHTIAVAYLRNARHCYLSWGAYGTVRRLENMYPHLGTEEHGPGPSNTIYTPVDRLDLATVIKVSQAVSSEIVLEKLLDTLMRTAIEQVGAERGLLILLVDAERLIAAEATSVGDRVEVQLRNETATAAVLPESVLHYILHSQEPLVLDDAATQDPFSADPYIRSRSSRSIVGAPLIAQGKLIGVLYLENNLARRVFVPARIAVLTLVASQAAIALENTQLYRDLQLREAKIRRLIDANIVGIFVANQRGGIIEGNDAFLRIVGYDREDLVAGRIRWTELTPPEWRERTARAGAELKTTGAIQPYEKEFLRKDGGRIPVLIGAANFQDGRRDSVAFVLDLTERRRAEEELRMSESRFRTFVDHATDAFMLHDEDGILLDVNQHACESLGYTRNELIGMSPIDFDPDANSAFVQNIHNRLDGQESLTFERRHRRKDGTVFPVEVRVREFMQGGRRLALSLTRDISERKHAEAEARESERRYREMQTELAHANRFAMMGQLTAAIAHEVNQPIAAAVTNANAGLRWLCAERPDLEEAREALGRIVKNGSRAGEVISRIRALVTKAPPRKDAVSINDAILEVIALTRREAVKNGVMVRTQLAEDLPTIEGDRVQLQQVILNLIVNAIEAMSGAIEGPRELLLSTGKVEADAVLVAVRDSGPGLARETVERLFEAFYTTKANGMGMGLSICRTIISAHGGRLWVSANEPRGAIFQFTVPAHPRDS